MSIQKPTLLCCLVSLGLALGFGFLVYRGLPAAGLSYGVISVDPSYNDRELRSLLAEAGIETVISESSQRVFYDSFDGIQAVPLDQYREYIDGVDPRDDGYAEKLRSVFIGKEGRRLFIPPRSGFFSGTQAALKGKVARALSGIPHSLKIEGFSRPLVFPLLVFAASSFLMLFFFRAGRVFVPALPLLGPLAWFGAPGFALAALACLMLEVLSPPLEEWTAGSPRLLRRPSGIKRLAASGFLLLCWGGLFIMSGIPLPLICILVPVLFLAWLSLWRKKALAQRLGHTRFVPLSILPEQGLFRESFRILLPFALGAAVAFAFPLFFQGIKLYHRSEMRNEISVTRADFEDHLSFQKDFSYRSLGAPEGQSAYGVYTLDGDGLIGDFTPASGAALPRIDAGDTALFSLLENSSTAAPPELSGLLWVAGLCALLLPSLLLRKKTGDRPGVSARYSDKRIAA